MTARTKTLALSTLASLALASTLKADTVELIKKATVKATGGQIKGTISAESPTEVKINGQSVPVDQIASVSYDGQPPSYTLATTRESNGNHAEAADFFKKAAAEASGKTFLVRAAQYGRAHALAELAISSPTRATEAVTELEAFIKANPSSRQLGPALESLARISLQQGNIARAESALNDLSKEVPWAADRAAILKARVLGRQNKYAEAIASLDKLISAAPAKSSKSFEAKLAKAEALAGKKQYDAAEKLVKDVIKEVPPEEAASQAMAHNTLGDCYRSAGRPKDALFEYLETDILFDKDKEQHQKALAQIAQTWRDLKQDGRADEALERLKQLYPNSPYLSARGTK